MTIYTHTEPSRNWCEEYSEWCTCANGWGKCTMTACPYRYLREKGKQKEEMNREKCLLILEDIIETFRSDEEYADWVEACAYAINLITMRWG